MGLIQVVGFGKHVAGQPVSGVNQASSLSLSLSLSHAGFLGVWLRIRTSMSQCRNRSKLMQPSCSGRCESISNRMMVVSL